MGIASHSDAGGGRRPGGSSDARCFYRREPEFWMWRLRLFWMWRLRLLSIGIGIGIGNLNARGKEFGLVVCVGGGVVRFFHFVVVVVVVLVGFRDGVSCGRGLFLIRRGRHFASFFGLGGCGWCWFGGGGGGGRSIVVVVGIADGVPFAFEAQRAPRGHTACDTDGIVVVVIILFIVVVVHHNFNVLDFIRIAVVVVVARSCRGSPSFWRASGHGAICLFVCLFAIDRTNERTKACSRNDRPKLWNRVVALWRLAVCKDTDAI